MVDYDFDVPPRLDLYMPSFSTTCWPRKREAFHKIPSVVSLSLSFFFSLDLYGRMRGHSGSPPEPTCWSVCVRGIKRHGSIRPEVSSNVTSFRLLLLFIVLRTSRCSSLANESTLHHPKDTQLYVSFCMLPTNRFLH